MKTNITELNNRKMKKVNGGYRHQGTHIPPLGTYSLVPLGGAWFAAKAIVGAINRSHNK